METRCDFAKYEAFASCNHLEAIRARQDIHCSGTTAIKMLFVKQAMFTDKLKMAVCLGSKSTST